LMSTGTMKRSEARALLSQENVTVDGKIVKSEHYFVQDPTTIQVHGRNLALPKEKLYFILNKPAGYHCQKTMHPNVYSILKEPVFAVGRLDRDTEGLLLMTNDGDFAYKIMSPEHHVEKEYYAQVLNELTNEDLSRLEKGVSIKLGATHYLTRPATVIQLGATHFRITITEGKKRQIRRMVKSLRNKVLTLKRIRIGGLTLGDLPPGTFRKLTREEAMQARSRPLNPS